MKNIKYISSFLISKGFELTQKESSPFFGDYYNTYCNDYFQSRLISSKSFESLDIKSNKSDENWFDLTLIKALLYNKFVINYAISIDEYWIFFENEYNNIVDLFNDRNYTITKKKLEELENRRAQQMFPGSYNEPGK